MSLKAALALMACTLTAHSAVRSRHGVQAEVCGRTVDERSKHQDQA